MQLGDQHATQLADRGGLSQGSSALSPRHGRQFKVAHPSAFEESRVALPQTLS